MEFGTEKLKLGIIMIKLIGVFGILLSTIPLKKFFSFLLKEEIKNITNPFTFFIYVMVEFVITLPLSILPLYMAWVLNKPIWGMLKLYLLLSVLASIGVTIIMMATKKKDIIKEIIIRITIIMKNFPQLSKLFIGYKDDTNILDHMFNILIILSLPIIFLLLLFSPYYEKLIDDYLEYLLVYYSITAVVLFLSAVLHSKNKRKN